MEADSCDIEFTCFYEEYYKEQAAVLRWFEVEAESSDAGWHQP